ncbi:MAG: FmdB family zinc ribbon protein [Anaerolineae bacterium]
MPTYQYACPDCGYQFEQRQKFTDDPIKRCPQCGRRHVYRVVSQVAVTFKGSGWYITDSRSSNGKSAETKGVKPTQPKEGEHRSAGESDKKAADASAKSATETGSRKVAEPAG